MSLPREDKESQSKAPSDSVEL